MLITNDGALAHDLLSPAKHVSKVYYAKIDGRVTEEDVNLFENGVDIGEEKPTKPALLEVLHSRQFGNQVNNYRRQVPSGKADV